jgi:hypothetical protein
MVYRRIIKCVSSSRAFYNGFTFLLWKNATIYFFFAFINDFCSNLEKEGIGIRKKVEKCLRERVPP